MKLVFKSGSILEKLEKVRIMDNMRDEIYKKIQSGIVFSNEATLALSQFPISDAETIFSIVNDKIEKGVYRFKTQKPKNWGYSFAEFHYMRYDDLLRYEGEELVKKIAEKEEKKDWLYYYISHRELGKINWTDSKNPPDFVLEVFDKLGCMPDEITH